jgi:hypothetical protein
MTLQDVLSRGVRMWWCVSVWAVPNMSRVLMQSPSVKMLQSFEPFGTTHLTTRCNISEDLNLQRRYCKNHKSHTHKAQPAVHNLLCTTKECEYSEILTTDVSLGTWILPIVPVESIRDASFTVLPQMSYTGLRAPITPPTNGPQLIPVEVSTS